MSVRIRRDVACDACGERVHDQTCRGDCTHAVRVKRANEGQHEDEDDEKEELRSSAYYGGEQRPAPRESEHIAVHILPTGLFLRLQHFFVSRKLDKVILQHSQQN